MGTDVGRTRSWGSLAALVAVAALTLVALPTVAMATHEDPAAPNDPLYERVDTDADQWGPQQVRTEQAHHLSTGNGAVIAIVDSGIDLDHPDLAANAIPGSTFIDCGATGCGNGDWDPEADNVGDPHGSHVAGIAGAELGNGEGTIGVAPDAQLMAVRALDDEGSGSFEDIAFGIRYAVDNGAHVINLSLGGLPGTQVLSETGFLPDVRAAIEHANTEGVTVVAASGNDSSPICGEPSFAPGVVCVTATSRQETLAEYSNQALKPDLLAVAAPGGGLADYLILCGAGVLSTVPPGQGNESFAESCGYPSELTYDEFIGTSMASPHAAGVAGLLVTQGCTRDQILELFETTSRVPQTEVHGAPFNSAYGYGIVDAEAATAAAVEICDPANAPPPRDDAAAEEQQPTAENTPAATAPASDQPAAAPATAPCSTAIDGAKGKQSLTGTAASERISGRGGKDRLRGDAGDDCLSGGGGADRLNGGGDDDELRGGRGKDRLNGAAGDDTIHAARGSRDRVRCGSGDDVAIVSAKKDRVHRSCETVRSR